MFLHEVSDLKQNTLMVNMARPLNLQSADVGSKDSGKSHLASHAEAPKPAEGMTFASILKDICMKVKPEEGGAVIRSVRQARNGGVLVELDKETQVRALFTKALEGAIGAAGTVEAQKPRVILKIVMLTHIPIRPK